MTPRQARFVAAYSGNATEAAEAAGYKGSDAVLATQGGRLLRNAEVAEAIKGRESKVTTSLVKTRQQRQEMWSTTMDDSRLDMSHRLRASELLGRSEGDFLDRVEHSIDKSLADLINESMQADE